MFEAPLKFFIGLNWRPRFTTLVFQLTVRDNEDEEDRDSVTVQVGSAAPPPPVPGDIDGDGQVTRADLEVLQSYLRQPASACPPCDLNGSGVATCACSCC